MKLNSFYTRSTSIIGMLASVIASNVLAQHAASAVPVTALPDPDMLALRRRYRPSTPVHRHGCNKRGGPSKRRRGLNYWRH